MLNKLMRKKELNFTEPIIPDNVIHDLSHGILKLKDILNHTNPDGSVSINMSVGHALHYGLYKDTVILSTGRTIGSMLSLAVSSLYKDVDSLIECYDIRELGSYPMMEYVYIVSKNYNAAPHKYTLNSHIINKFISLVMNISDPNDIECVSHLINLLITRGGLEFSTELMAMIVDMVKHILDNVVLYKSSNESITPVMIVMSSMNFGLLKDNSGNDMIHIVLEIYNTFLESHDASDAVTKNMYFVNSLFNNKYVDNTFIFYNLVYVHNFKRMSAGYDYDHIVVTNVFTKILESVRGDIALFIETIMMLTTHIIPDNIVAIHDEIKKDAVDVLSRKNHPDLISTLHNMCVTNKLSLLDWLHPQTLYKQDHNYNDIGGTTYNDHNISAELLLLNTSMRLISDTYDNMSSISSFRKSHIDIPLDDDIFGMEYQTIDDINMLLDDMYNDIYDRIGVLQNYDRNTANYEHGVMTVPELLEHNMLSILEIIGTQRDQYSKFSNSVFGFGFVILLRQVVFMNTIATELKLTTLEYIFNMFADVPYISGIIKQMIIHYTPVVRDFVNYKRR